MNNQPAETNDRPIDLRAELTNMLSVVDGNVSITREQMEVIGDHLQMLWGRAHDAHDEASLAVIADLWDRAQLLVEQNASLAFQVTGMGSIAVSALEGERATREALDEIEDALESADEDHPKLMEFAQTIRYDASEQFDEQLNEEIIPEIMEVAYEEQNGYLGNVIIELTGCSQLAADVFIEMLDNSFIPNDAQVEMLKALLDTFEVEAQRRRAKRVKDRFEVAAELRDWNENGH